MSEATALTTEPQLLPECIHCFANENDCMCTYLLFSHNDVYFVSWYISFYLCVFVCLHTDVDAFYGYRFVHLEAFLNLSTRMSLSVCLFVGMCNLKKATTSSLGIIYSKVLLRT